MSDIKTIEMKKNTNTQANLFELTNTASSQLLIGEAEDKIQSAFPMQYLGGKGRISNWIIENIKNAFPNCDNFLDLFAGTGIVTLHAQKYGFNVVANDYEPYSYAILKALLSPRTEGLQKAIDIITQTESKKCLLGNGRSFLRKYLDEEEKFILQASTNEFNWEEYRAFCRNTPIINGDNEEVLKLRKSKKWNLFSRYYANTYFGIRQCLEIDSIRELAEKYPEAKPYLLAATISAMTYGVSSTTHLAQYLRPQSLKTALHLIKRRKFSFVNTVKKSLSQFVNKENNDKCDRTVHMHDFRVMLQEVALNKSWVIYADPPYFKEHYSRYYHVLNTFCLYDFPFLTYNNQLKCVTEGRYREGRNISDFGKKSLVKAAFRDLFSRCAETGCKLALSYAETSLVKKSEIISMANDLNLNIETVETALMHSSQGQVGRTKNVREYLFLIQ